MVNIISNLFYSKKNVYLNNALVLCYPIEPDGPHNAEAAQDRFQRFRNQNPHPKFFQVELDTTLDTFKMRSNEILENILIDRAFWSELLSCKTTDIEALIQNRYYQCTVIFYDGSQDFYLPLVTSENYNHTKLNDYFLKDFSSPLEITTGQSASPIEKKLFHIDSTSNVEPLISPPGTMLSPKLQIQWLKCLALADMEAEEFYGDLHKPARTQFFQVFSKALERYSDHIRTTEYEPIFTIRSNESYSYKVVQPSKSDNCEALEDKILETLKIFIRLAGNQALPQIEKIMQNTDDNIIGPENKWQHLCEIFSKTENMMGFNADLKQLAAFSEKISHCWQSTQFSNVIPAAYLLVVLFTFSEFFCLSNILSDEDEVKNILEKLRQALTIFTDKKIQTELIGNLLKSVPTIAGYANKTQKMDDNIEQQTQQYNQPQSNSAVVRYARAANIDRSGTSEIDAFQNDLSQADQHFRSMYHLSMLYPDVFQDEFNAVQAFTIKRLEISAHAKAKQLVIEIHDTPDILCSWGISSIETSQYSLPKFIIAHRPINFSQQYCLSVINYIRENISLTFSKSNTDPHNVGIQELQPAIQMILTKCDEMQAALSSPLKENPDLCLSHTIVTAKDALAFYAQYQLAPKLLEVQAQLHRYSNSLNGVVATLLQQSIDNCIHFYQEMHLKLCNIQQIILVGNTANTKRMPPPTPPRSALPLHVPAPIIQNESTQPKMSFASHEPNASLARLLVASQTRAGIRNRSATGTEALSRSSSPLHTPH